MLYKYLNIYFSRGRCSAIKMNICSNIKNGMFNYIAVAVINTDLTVFQWRKCRYSSQLTFVPMEYRYSFHLSVKSVFLTATDCRSYQL